MPYKCVFRSSYHNFLDGSFFLINPSKRISQKACFFVDDSTSFLFVFLDQGCYHLTIFNKFVEVVNKFVEMVIVHLENFT